MPSSYIYDFETDLSHGCKQAQPNIPALKTNSKLCSGPPWNPLKHFALYAADYLDGSSQTHEMPFRRQRPFLWSLKCVNNNPGALYKSLSQGVKKVRKSEGIKTATYNLPANLSSYKDYFA